MVFFEYGPLIGKKGAGLKGDEEMEKLKRTAALALVLLMALSLCACGKSPLAGTWEGRMDISGQAAAWTEAALEGLAPAAAGGEELPELSDYLGDFGFGYIIVFNEDGSYSAGPEEGELSACLESLGESVKEYYRQYMFRALCRTAEDMGLGGDINSIQQLEQLMGVSMEEAVSQILGMDLDALAETLREGLRAKLAGLELEGRYEAGDGELLLSSGPEAAPSEGSRLGYVLEGDRLSLREDGGAPLFSLEGISLPELRRAS